MSQIRQHCRIWDMLFMGEQFIAEMDIENMSVRELKKAVKEREQALQDWKQAFQERDRVLQEKANIKKALEKEKTPS